ncbi:MAG: hypothetical protein HDT12_00490 [Helicobacter sp.]|nr:hypothetical protein [Helicobacter sp.]
MLEDTSRLFLNVKEKIESVFVSDKKSILDLEIEFRMRLIEECIQNYNLILLSSDDKNKIIINFKQIAQYLEQNSADTKDNNENLLKTKENIKSLLNDIVDTMLTSIKEYPKGFSDNVENGNSEEVEIAKGAYDRIDKNLVSLDEKIKNINNETSKNLQECQNKYDEISQKIQNIKKDFIELSQMSGSLEGKVNGIDTKLENKWNKLEKFGNEINALMNPGKEMLGITTIASLAEFYKNTRISYEKEMLIWQALFFASIMSMFLIGRLDLFGADMNISFGFNEYLNINIDNYLSILGLFVVKLPFYIPMVWFTIFTSKKQSEAKRLRDEYKHKETFANTYYGYKEQIKDLKDEKAQELAAKLMQNLVKMTNENPNRALDKVKTENIPTIEVIEKFLKLSKDF